MTQSTDPLRQIMDGTIGMEWVTSVSRSGLSGHDTVIIQTNNAIEITVRQTPHGFIVASHDFARNKKRSVNALSVQGALGGVAMLLDDW